MPVINRRQYVTGMQVGSGSESMADPIPDVSFEVKYLGFSGAEESVIDNLNTENGNLDVTLRNSDDRGRPIKISEEGVIKVTLTWTERVRQFTRGEVSIIAQNDSNVRTLDGDLIPQQIEEKATLLDLPHLTETPDLDLSFDKNLLENLEDIRDKFPIPRVFNIYNFVRLTGRRSVTEYIIDNSSWPISDSGSSFTFYITPASNSAGTLTIEVNAATAQSEENRDSYGPPVPRLFQIKYDYRSQEIEGNEPTVKIITPRLSVGLEPGVVPAQGNLPDIGDIVTNDFTDGNIPTHGSEFPSSPTDADLFILIPDDPTDPDESALYGLYKYNELSGWVSVLNLSEFFLYPDSDYNIYWLGFGDQASKYSDSVNSLETAKNWFGKYITNIIPDKTLYYYLDTQDTSNPGLRKVGSFQYNPATTSNATETIYFTWNEDINFRSGTNPFADTDIDITGIDHEGQELTIVKGSLSPIGTSERRFQITLNIPQMKSGTIIITINSDAARSKSSDKDGPPESVTASFDFSRSTTTVSDPETDILGEDGTALPASSYICNIENVNFGSINLYEVGYRVNDENERYQKELLKGAYKGILDMVKVGSYLYAIVQIQRHTEGSGEPPTHLRDAQDAAAVLIEMNATTSSPTNNCKVLKIYDHVLTAPQYLTVYNDTLYFVEGSHRLEPYLDKNSTEESDWRDDVGYLRSVNIDRNRSNDLPNRASSTQLSSNNISPTFGRRDEDSNLTGIVINEGIVWDLKVDHPTSRKLYENNVYGIFWGSSSRVVCENDNLHVMAGFGNYNHISTNDVKTNRRDGRPITHVNNVLWLQRSKTLNRRIEKLETNDRAAWDVLLELSNLTASYIGFRKGQFFLQPRYPIKGKLSKIIDINKITNLIVSVDFFQGSDFEYRISVSFSAPSNLKTHTNYRLQETEVGSPIERGARQLADSEEDGRYKFVADFGNLAFDDGTSYTIEVVAFEAGQPIENTRVSYNIPTGVTDGTTYRLNHDDEAFQLEGNRRDIPNPMELDTLNNGYFLINSEIISYTSAIVSNDKVDLGGVTRNEKETTIQSHAIGDDAYYVDHIIDDRHLENPLEALNLSQDTDQLVNKLTIKYGDNGDLEYYSEDKDSVEKNGGRDLELTLPLSQHQEKWLEWIAKIYLETFSQIRYICEVSLKPSLFLSVGETVMIRDNNPDNDIYNDIVFEILSIEYDETESTSSITIRSLN